MTRYGKPVPLPKKGVQVYGKQGHRYAYKVTRTYRNAKGQPTCDRISIGKVDDETEMLLPNMSFYELCPEEAAAAKAAEAASVPEKPQAGSVSEAGVTFALQATLAKCGALGMIAEALGSRKAGELMTVAAHMLAEGNVMGCLDDFSERALVPAAMDGRRASDLFASIAPEDRASFFSRWASAQAGNGYVAYDVTSFSSYSEGIGDLEWGYNRDGERLPQVNLGMYVGVESGLPVFYRTYPGSIIDKSHLHYMMDGNDEMGVGEVTFVMDRGFASVANLKHMREKEYPYLVGLEAFRKACRNAIDSMRGELSSARSWIPEGSCHGAARNVVFYGTYSRLCAYHDQERAAAAERDMHRRMTADEERLTQMPEITQKDAKRYASRGFSIERNSDGTFEFERDWAQIDAKSRDLGYFCILTSDLDAAPADVLACYRKRDVVEKAFDEMKNQLDMRRLRTHSQATTDGKMFCAFVSLIARMYAGNALGGWMRENRCTFERVIRELTKIRCVEGADGKRMLNPLTKRQREIVQGIGYTEADVRSFVEHGGTWSA